MAEPTLADVVARLEAIEKKLEKLDGIEKQLQTLDSRLFELTMRIVTANSSAFFGVGIALLSAAIAFVVARVSGGRL